MKISYVKRFLIFYLVLLCLFSCRAIKEPDYKNMNNLLLTKLGADESTFSLQLNYFNPNHFGLRLKEVEGDAWLDSTYLGHFWMDTLIHIPANSDFSVPVKLGVDMKHVFQNAFAAIFNSELILKIDGRAKFGKAGVFIHYPIHYQGRQNFTEILK